MITLEEQHATEPYYLGWEWTDVRLHTSTLNHLLLKGVIIQNYRSNRSTSYMLINRELTKAALQYAEVADEMKTVDQQQIETPADLFSVIEGFDEIKTLVNRSLKSDKPVHFLFEGPPSCAKSLFLLELLRLKNSRYALGSSTRKAGLTRFLIDSQPRLLLIDEIDKFDHPTDQYALLSLMQDGIVTELKTGRTQTIKLTCSVFAAANDANKIPRELRSRFARFRFREYTEEEFVRVAYKVLTERENAPQELASQIAHTLAKRTRDVRDAVKFTRLCSSKQEVDELLQTMLKYNSFNV